NFGWIGVDLFFVLSGYLIGNQIFKPLAAGDNPSLGAFFIRRFLRTLPCYYAVLGIYFLWNDGAAPTAKYVFFTQNFGIPETFAPSWSLCVEEQFYLLFPLIVLALHRLGCRNWFDYIVPAFLATEVVLRFSIWFAVRPDLMPEPRALNAYMGTLYYP